MCTLARPHNRMSMMIDSIKTEAIKDLLVTEFPDHQVNSKLVSGQQYYQIKKARSTVAILCVDPDYFAGLSSADDVRQNLKANAVITPLKQENAAVNIVLLAKHHVTMNDANGSKDRQAGVLLDLLGNWHPAHRLPAPSPNRRVRFSRTSAQAQPAL